MKRTMKRALTVLVAICLMGAVLLSLGACHKKDKQETADVLASVVTTQDGTTAKKAASETKTGETTKTTIAAPGPSETNAGGTSTSAAAAPASASAAGGLFQVSDSYKQSHSYCVAVNTAQNVVIVYGKGADGNYTEPVKAMACSCGRAGHETPSGQYTTLAKQRWLYLIDGTYGQYCTKFKEHYWFHSVPYYSQDPSDLEYTEYNKLGSNASAGCVRMCVRDVKWVYDNLSGGTVVRVYASSAAEPLAKPASIRIDTSESNANRGWDPTDPDPANPYS